MKASYRVSRLLKRFVPDGFGDTFLDPDLSSAGKTESENHFKENKRAALLKSDPFAADHQAPEKQQYVTYQKEIQAGRLAGVEKQPQSPGKILKLPLDLPFQENEE